MRGVIPTLLLSRLAELLEARGDSRPLADHFDLIAGTSTGGLIALALTVPLARSGFPQETGERSTVTRTLPRSWWERICRRSAREEAVGLLPEVVGMDTIRNLYHRIGTRIFPAHSGRFFASLFSDKYDVAPLEGLLADLFKDVPLKDAVVPVMTTSYNLLDPARPYLFTSRDSHGYLFREAGRATSAAPTYFRPAFLTDRQTGEEVALVDGGVVANNPVLYAYREARKLYPSCRTFHILSLATRCPRLNLTGAGKSGLMGWADPTQGFPFQKVVSTAAEQTASTILSSIPGVDYVRVEGPLTTSYKLDETSEEALKALEADGERMFAAKREEVERYADLLAARTTFDQLVLDPLPPATGKERSHALQTPAV